MTDKIRQIKTNKYDFTYTWNVKKKTKDKHNNAEIFIDTENKQVIARGEWGRKEEK